MSNFDTPKRAVLVGASVFVVAEVVVVGSILAEVAVDVRAALAATEVAVDAGAAAVGVVANFAYESEEDLGAAAYAAL